MYLVSAITRTHTHTHTCAWTHVPTPICSTLFHHKHMQNSIGEGLRFCGKVCLHGNMVEALRCLVQCGFSDRQRTVHPLFHNLIDCEFPLQNPHVISPTPPRPISPPWIPSQDSHLLQNSTSNILRKFHSRNTTCVLPWTGHSHRRFHLYSGMERNTCPLEKTKIQVIPLWDCSLRCYVTFLLRAGRGFVLRSQNQDPILLNNIESYNIAELWELY